MQVGKLGASANLLSIGKFPHSEDFSAPLVRLVRADHNIYLVVRWRSSQGEMDVSQYYTSSPGSGPIHIMIVRDKDRLGAWVNGDGKWFPGSVWCLPERKDVLFCDHEPVGSGFYWEDSAAMWIGGHHEGFTAEISSLKLYNFAFPPVSWQDERSWLTDSHAPFTIHPEDEVW